jgi:hypothetical protein
MSAQIFFMPNKMEKGLIDHFQSDITAKIFGYLHNYAAMKGGSFYKFKEPCEHPLYRVGDSWKETLKMTKRVFNPEFDKLVNYHRSKKAFKGSADPFAGKLFCSYFERTTKTTYYIENKGLVEQLINLIKAKLDSSPPRSSSKSKDVDVVILQPKNTPIVSPTGEQIVSPNVLLRNTKQAITSFAEPPSKPAVDNLEEEKIKLSVKEMVNTWNSQMQDRVILWPSMVSKLHKILQTYFGGDLEKFKKYCEAMASDKFLSGKASSNYKLFFLQAIKPEFLEANREIANPPQRQSLNLDNQTNLINAHFDDRKVKLYTPIADKAKEDEKKIVNNTIASLSENEVEILTKEWESDYFARNPNANLVDTDRFSKMLRRIDFENFRDVKIRAQLGLSNEEQQQQELCAA